MAGLRNGLQPLASLQFRKRARFSRLWVCWRRFSRLSSCDAGSCSNFRNSRAFCFQKLLVWRRRRRRQMIVASAFCVAIFLSRFAWLFQSNASARPFAIWRNPTTDLLRVVRPKLRKSVRERRRHYLRTSSRWSNWLSRSCSRWPPALHRNGCFRSRPC
jgi:hypothetical protein